MSVRLQQIRDAMAQFEREQPPGLDPRTRDHFLLVAVRVALAAPRPALH